MPIIMTPGGDLRARTERFPGRYRALCWCCYRAQLGGDRGRPTGPAVNLSA